MRSILPYAASLAFACLPGCKGDPERVASPDLVGSWRNEQGATLSFQSAGLVTFSRPDPKARPAIGEYTYDGERLTFMFRPESRWCTNDDGVYRVQLESGAFEATVVSDTCKERERLTKGRWQRTEIRR
jgi:hypothetical protein